MKKPKENRTNFTWMKGPDRGVKCQTTYINHNRVIVDTGIDKDGILKLQMDICNDNRIYD
jgi:hypothetical protein